MFFVLLIGVIFMLQSRDNFVLCLRSVWNKYTLYTYSCL